MDSDTFDDIQTGLKEKRANLEHWHETASEEKVQCQLCAEADTAFQAHMDLIDGTLAKIDQGEYGICEVCHEQIDHQLLQMDYTASVCLGHFTDAELRELESELELSQIVQRALLPQQAPSIEGMNIAAFSRPAQIVSGDYFDFLKFKDELPGLIIADVSGHGVSAGMLMTSLQTAFHTLTPEVDSPASVLERINRLYIHNINMTTFVTAFFGKLDPQARTLTYASAGHNAYLYRAASREDLWLGPTSPAIGLVEDFSCRLAKIDLNAGDILLLYTDGASEAFNSQRKQFGEEALADVIRQNADATAESLIAKILQALNDFTDGIPLGDDLTLVVCKVR